MQVVMSDDGAKQSKVSKAIEDVVVELLIQEKTFRFIKKHVAEEHDRTLSDPTIVNIKTRNKLYIDSQKASRRASKLADPKELLKRVRALATQRVELYELEMTRYNKLLKKYYAEEINDEEFDKQKRKLYLPTDKDLVSIMKEMDVQSGNALARAKELKTLEINSQPPQQQQVSNPKLRELTDKIMSGKNILIQEIKEEKDAKSEDQASNHSPAKD